MISPEELERYVSVMRAGGVALFKCGDTQIVLGPPKLEALSQVPHQKDNYRDLLFAATEGMPDPDEAQS